MSHSQCELIHLITWKLICLTSKTLCEQFYVNWPLEILYLNALIRGHTEVQNDNLLFLGGLCAWLFLGFIAL